jgi:hypothetical protein
LEKHFVEGGVEGRVGGVFQVFGGILGGPFAAGCDVFGGDTHYLGRLAALNFSYWFQDA